MLRYLIFAGTLDTCPFCQQKETSAHAYLVCAGLQPLFHLLQNLVLKFWLQFCLCFFIYTLPNCGPMKPQDFLVHLLLGLAKLAIYT